MALRPLNSEGGFGIDSGNTIIQANGAVTTSDLSVSDLANIANLVVTQLVDLGAIGNITITGGSDGQVITTDGAGNLSFADGGTGDSFTPTLIPEGGTFTVPLNKQAFFVLPIDIQGDLQVDGVLIEID